MIFPSPRASYDLTSYPDELLLVPREDGGKVPCIFLPFRHARFLVIYFHANAEDLGLCYPFCKIMRDLFQVHVMAMEYPGYGICPGKADEAGIMANAEAVMRFATETLAWPCDGIKLFGRSLGTGPCVALAAQYEVAGVILISPFTSIRNLFQAQVGSLAEVVNERFPNIELIDKLKSPTLIIHGQKDTLVPTEHGKELYALLKTRKMMVCPAAMSHNTSLLKNIGTLVLPMTQFFSLPDYTFEDIEVPPWAFPRTATSKPAANCRISLGEEVPPPGGAATDRLSAPTSGLLAADCSGGAATERLSGDSSPWRSSSGGSNATAREGGDGPPPKGVVSGLQATQVPHPAAATALPVRDASVQPVDEKQSYL